MTQEEIYRVVEKSLNFFSTQFYYDSFLEARKFYFSNSGVLDEANPDYNLRINQFLDWYFFSRPLDNFRLPPSHCGFMVPELKWAPEEAVIVDQLKDVRHSLFEVVKQKDMSLTLVDLFDGSKWSLDLGPKASLFLKKQIIEARVFTKTKAQVLLKGIVFHPLQANSFLNNEIKAYRKDLDKDRDQLMLIFSKMRYQAERYNYAKLELIYNWSNPWIEHDKK